MTATAPPGPSDAGPADPPPAELEAEGPRYRLEHHRAIRWMHWLNFPLLTLMIWSGYRIYWADLRDPFVAGVGDRSLFEFWPDWFDARFDLERRLARGLALHLTLGWFFAANGVAYGLYLWRSGEWRHLLPERGSFRHAGIVFLHDIGLRRGARPPQGKYNGAQRLSYSLIIGLGGIEVLTGLAIYKPTQLALLTSAFGGYESARTIHFVITLIFIAFFAVHIFQVAKEGTRGIGAMITGYRRIDDERGDR